MALTVVLTTVAVLLIVSALSLLLHGTALGRNLVYGASLAASGVGLAVGLGALLSQAPAETSILPIGLPWLGAQFPLDALSAFFLVVINLGGAAASLYALGFGRHETAPQRVLPFYPLFLAAMTLVVIADDAFTFLFSWEFMSLSSWALVMAHDHVRENLRAGYVYLVMASFGTFALLLAFGLLAGPDGAYAFDAIRTTHPTPTLVAIVLVLVLIGTGSKAGLVPLHAWLPLAHPAAPSHVSGLLSGVMTKVAVYAFVRIVFDL
jgi:formate hydrogenlyase subunit 3/multisubunit Na+/H+ antiporter MnhD subunit